MKITAIAPSNIAFIKYWGKKDEKLRLPANGSISVNLSNLTTTTTVEIRKDLKEDKVIINGREDYKKAERVIKHLDKVRKIAKISLKAKVVSQNNFPTASGLASSASGFAALTFASTKAAGLNLSEKELSILARQGSGSACRSIPDGFSEWLDGDINKTSYAVSIYPPNYWNLVFVIVLSGNEEKTVLTTEGMKRMQSNPFYSIRLSHLKNKIKLVKKFLKEKDFINLGEIIESEALELHAMALTSSPPIIYWQPNTIKTMKLVQQIRKSYFPTYFTIDSGPHVCIICEEKNLKNLLKNLKDNKITNFIVNKPSIGARLINTHLF